MPLDRYGVLVGTLRGHAPDRPGEEGPYFHVNLRVRAPGGTYRCVVDVDSKHSDTGVEWKLLTAPHDAIVAAGREPGFHDLARSPASGAIDVYRLPAIASTGDWHSGSQVEATAALEPILEPGRRILVFGEPFRPGLGMHSVHQNQGDPRGSRWADENAIWQDGATMTLRPDGALDVFVSRFSSQSDDTDEHGRPRRVTRA